MFVRACMCLCIHVSACNWVGACVFLGARICTNTILKLIKCLAQLLEMVVPYGPSSCITSYWLWSCTPTFALRYTLSLEDCALFCRGMIKFECPNAWICVNVCKVAKMMHFQYQLCLLNDATQACCECWPEPVSVSSHSKLALHHSTGTVDTGTGCVPACNRNLIIMIDWSFERYPAWHSASNFFHNLHHCSRMSLWAGQLSLVWVQHYMEACAGIQWPATSAWAQVGLWPSSCILF